MKTKSEDASIFSKTKVVTSFYVTKAPLFKVNILNQHCYKTPKSIFFLKLAITFKYQSSQNYVNGLQFRSDPLCSLLFQPARPLGEGAALPTKEPLTLRVPASEQGTTPPDLPDFLVPSPRQVQFRHQPQSSAG